MKCSKSSCSSALCVFVRGLPDDDVCVCECACVCYLNIQHYRFRGAEPLFYTVLIFMKTLLSHLPPSLSLVIPALFSISAPVFLLFPPLGAPQPIHHLDKSQTAPPPRSCTSVLLSQGSFFLHGTYVPFTNKDPAHNSKERNRWREGRGGVEETQRQGGSTPAQKGNAMHDTAKPISAFIPLGKHTRMQKKQSASRKNKSLHFLDVLVALTFACAVSLLTNVTNAHPSPVISFAEAVLVSRNRRE